MRERERERERLKETLRVREKKREKYLEGRSTKHWAPKRRSNSQPSDLWSVVCDEGRATRNDDLGQVWQRASYGDDERATRTGVHLTSWTSLRRHLTSWGLLCFVLGFGFGLLCIASIKVWFTLRATWPWVWFLFDLVICFFFFFFLSRTNIYIFNFQGVPNTN